MEKGSVSLRWGFTETRGLELSLYKMEDIPFRVNSLKREKKKKIKQHMMAGNK